MCPTHQICRMKKTEFRSDITRDLLKPAQCKRRPGSCAVGGQGWQVRPSPPPPRMIRHGAANWLLRFILWHFLRLIDVHQLNQKKKVIIPVAPPVPGQPPPNICSLLCNIHLVFGELRFDIYSVDSCQLATFDVSAQMPFMHLFSSLKKLLILKYGCNQFERHNCCNGSERRPRKRHSRSTLVQA